MEKGRTARLGEARAQRWSGVTRLDETKLIPNNPPLELWVIFGLP